MTKPPFNLLTIQTTRACNLRCLYCYQDDESYKSPLRITLDIFKRLIESLIAYHRSIGSAEPISITFHGGEPLLLGHEFFRDALNHLATLDNSPNKDRFSLAVQTNLTLLDEPYCHIFREHKVTISTSIDGPSWLHNKFRGRVNGDNHAAVMRNGEQAGEQAGRTKPTC